MAVPSPLRPVAGVSLDALAGDLAQAAALSPEIRRAVMLQCLTILGACAVGAGATAPPPPSPVEEQYVSAEEGARLLGVTPRWLYRNKQRLPFVRRLSRKVLQVSLPALRRWQQAQKPR
jgi:hypothetical protein